MNKFNLITIGNNNNNIDTINKNKNEWINDKFVFKTELINQHFFSVCIKWIKSSIIIKTYHSIIQ